MPLVAIVTLLSLVIYFFTLMKVGRARGMYDIKAPAVTGHPAFERAYRVQLNTVEMLVMHLPALWLFAWFVSPLWAAPIGLVWIVGRILYARGYYEDPVKRSTGMIIAMLSTGVLLVGALIGSCIASYYLLRSGF